MSTINIAKGHVLHGVFDVQSGDTLTVNGPGKFAPSAFTDDGIVTISAKVIGGGVIDGGVGATMTFTNSVGPHVQVDLNLGDFITIDDPKSFHGTLGFVTQTQPVDAPYAEYFQLSGLADAVGYTLQHDMLTLLGPNMRPIDRVHLQPGISFTTITEDAGSVYLADGYGVYKEPGFGTAHGPTLLPNLTHVG